MKEKVKDYLPQIRSKTHEFATLLDLRFNHSSKKLIMKTMSKLQIVFVYLLIFPLNMPQQMRSSNFSDRMFKRARVTNEIDEYIVMTQSPRDVNPLDWWKLQKGHLLQLCQLAYNILCIPGSSVK